MVVKSDIDWYGEALGVKVYTIEITGKPVNQDLVYEKLSEEQDEVDNLHSLLKEIQSKHNI